MKAKSQRSALLFLIIALSILTQVSQAVHFYAAKGKERCFSDTVVKNNVSHFIHHSHPNNHVFFMQTLEMEVQVMDEDVLKNLVYANDAMINKG